jgi:hypothetical protein
MFSFDILYTHLLSPKDYVKCTFPLVRLIVVARHSSTHSYISVSPSPLCRFAGVHWTLALVSPWHTS